MSYTEKSWHNESCIVTTWFEDKECGITDSNDSPTKTTNQDKTHQLFGGSDSDADFDLKNMEFMGKFNIFFDFN